MLMDTHTPYRTVADAGYAGGRHAAPKPPTRPRRGPLTTAVLTILVLAVGAAATTAALLLRGSAPDPVDSALGQLRQWPSTTVDGYLTGPAEPVRVVATVTGDGAARGTASRSRNARADFVVGPAGTLIRGNAQWWVDGKAGPAAQLADRWIRDPHDGAVDQIAVGRLAPAALADALAALRDPDVRAEAEVVVNGVPGRAFMRDGTRLVVDHDGRPLAMAVRIPSSTWAASITVGQPGPADEDTVRRAAGDVLAEVGGQGSSGPVPSLDEIRKQGSAGRVNIEVLPDPKGCPPAGCAMHYRLTNASSAAVTGLFTLRVDGHLVVVKTLLLPPRTGSEVSAWIPGPVLTAHPERRLKIEATFTPDREAAPKQEAREGAVGGEDFSGGEV
jgi:hypothetical protein